MSYSADDQIFRAIHSAYVAYVCNPFTLVATTDAAALASATARPIRSKRFDAQIAAIASSYTMVDAAGG